MGSVTHLKTIAAMWRRWHTGCLTEKLMIMYSSSFTCHERTVTTSLFFIGFGQSPVEIKDIKSEKILGYVTVKLPFLSLVFHCPNLCFNK